jgi:hypothetical protein
MANRPILNNRTLLRPRLCGSLQPLVLALGLVFSGAAGAETSPYYYGIGQSFTFDSNPNNLANESDTYSSTTVFAGFSQPVSRQRFYGDISASVNRFFSNGQLNNVSYSLQTGVDWEAINRLSGNISYGMNRNLAALSATSSMFNGKNIEDTGQFNLSGRWGFGARTSLLLGYQHREIDLSVEDVRDAKYNIFNVGLEREFSPDLDAGVGLRYTRGALFRYAAPNSTQLVGYNSDRKDIDFTGRWTITGLSTVNGRVSLTNESYDSGIAGRDFSGVTGFINWRYQPTAKLVFNTAFIRDIGSSSNFNVQPITVNTTNTATGNNAVMQTGPLITTIANTTVNNTLQFGVGYEVTSKIQLNGGLRYSRGTDRTDNGSSASSNTVGTTLGFTYLPTRSVSLGCNYAHENRSTSMVTAFEYSANTITCYGRLTLR